jgi:hypothetical protein
VSRSTSLRCGAVVACAAAWATAGGANAWAEPAGSCPTPYELFAIPADGSRPVAAQADAKGNGDGYACQKPAKGGTYNVIDNRVQGRR